MDSFLKVFFGHHADRVRANFAATDGYGKLFVSVNDEWAADDKAYRESRALRIFHATSEFSAGMVACSGGRHKTQYIPMMYLAARQTAEHGDLWPRSTRSVEGRGGRIKINKRTKVCHRPRTVTAGEVMRAIDNLQKGAHSYRASNNNTSPSEQMMRLACQQQESAHRKDGRQRLALTGRKTLARVLPKWLTEELPVVDQSMLELSELLRMACAVAELIASGVLEIDSHAMRSCQSCSA